jgi:hypothetical protein
MHSTKAWEEIKTMFEDRLAELSRNLKRFYPGVLAKVAAFGALMFGMSFFPAAANAQQPDQKTFPLATDATKALIVALQADDQAILLNILGPDAKDILYSGDDVEDKNDRDQFVQKYQQMHRIVTESDGKATLYIGAENWPWPIPLGQKNGTWYFDTPAGKQEILYRRIGKNELYVVQVCRELVDAEKEYAAQSHDGRAGHRYAQKFFSDPGKHDGLYWPVSSGETESPIGPLVASAAVEGYTKDSEQQRQPFQGYYFRILKPLPVASPGSSSDPKTTTRGFAFLAYPAEYRSSGVMTFFVDEIGVVYEKDLGRRTAQIAATVTRQDRDTTWRRAD